MERTTRDYNLVISLGLTCQTAWHLERLGFRSNTGPFDWFITPFKSLSTLINSEFSGFMKRDSLEIIGTFDNKWIVKDSTYEVKSYHDFLMTRDKEIDPISYQNFREKLNRRVDRFLTQLKTTDTILFVVHNGPTQLEEYLPLIAAIEKSRKGRYFHVFACGIASTMRVEGLPMSFHQFKNICMSAPNERWKGCDANWDILMKDIKLLPK